VKSQPSQPNIISMGSPGGDFVASMHQKKEVISRLCSALHEFLCFDVDWTIKRATMPMPKMPRPTMDDLNDAQEELDAAEMQLEAMRRLAAEMPREMGDAYLLQIPMLERLMEPMKQRVAIIQKAMEEPEPDPSSPWDGSHHIGTLCAQCAVNYPGAESSIPALKVALKAAGWGRDSDGDHICPSCYAALMVSLATQSAEPATETGTLNPKEPIA
jgi:hypothetical protein